MQLRDDMTHYLNTVGVEADVDDVAVRRRSAAPHVQYHVGQIMHHVRYNYRCVIYGWTPVCEESMAWQLQMGIHHLIRGAQQPFYRVLVDDASWRYAAQGVICQRVCAQSHCRESGRRTAAAMRRPDHARTCVQVFRAQTARSLRDERRAQGDVS